MRFTSLVHLSSAAVVLALSLSASAQTPTNEASEAAINNPTEECTYYTYTPVQAAMASFPSIWTPATLLASDSAGQAKWNSIKASVPTNIPVKGTITGDFSQFTPTYNPDDPDCWWSYSKCVVPKLAGLAPDTATVPEPLTLGYGFDDGPNCSHNAFYDYLTEQNQKATMFYIGSNVMDWPLQAQRAITDGHEICVHTWSHRYMTAFQSEDAFAELWYTLNAIKLVTGVTPTCWRPPYGDVDDRIRSIAKGLGLRTILWEYDSNDWQVGATNVTPAQVDANYQALINNATSGVYNTQGTIMLTHELNNYTMQEAINFYPKLKAAFKGGVVPVGVAVNITHPYVEQNYSLPVYSAYINGQTTASASAGGSSASASATSAGSGTGTTASSAGAKSSGSSAQGASGAVAVGVNNGVIVGGLVAAVAFLGGVAQVLA